MAVQLGQHGVLAAGGLGDDEIGEHEQRHEEGHHQEERGQHVDEARPIIGLEPSAAGARQRHGYLRSSRAGNFALSVIWRRTVASSCCCWACSSAHSRTTFCSARIWRISLSTPAARSLTASPVLSFSNLSSTFSLRSESERCMSSKAKRTCGAKPAVPGASASCNSVMPDSQSSSSL